MPPTTNTSDPRPRLLVIGAGSRGHAYARVIHASSQAIIAAVAEPIEFKRNDFGKQYIWSGADGPSQEDQAFTSWSQFLRYEHSRREREAAGERVLPGVDGIFVCTLDETHRGIIEAFAPLGLHVMCEKPLATRLEDCLEIFRAMKEPGTGVGGERKGMVNGNGSVKGQKNLFSIGHVLRYSPHNMLLRKLVLEDKVIGDVLNIEHTEPVGWWHFSHSYVRGNWRKESVTAPSLLTKCCHDIDFLLWMLSSNIDPAKPPHLPSTVSSTGALTYFKRSRKPKAAGNATNCLSCPAEPDCNYSAKNIYAEYHLEQNEDRGWPVKIVDPEIEDCWKIKGKAAAKEKLLNALAVDYDDNTPQSEIDARPWFGRCVYESANDVCDDQTVTMTWDEDNVDEGRGAKSALFHMAAFTEAQCDRRGRICGTEGEISYDSKRITVYYFKDKTTKEHFPAQPGGGHGGGDAGLAMQYVKAIDAVKNHGVAVEDAQARHIGCTMEEVIRSHAMVFAAEEARLQKKVVDWVPWWDEHVKA